MRYDSQIYVLSILLLRGMCIRMAKIIQCTIYVKQKSLQRRRAEIVRAHTNTRKHDDASKVNEIRSYHTSNVGIYEPKILTII